MVDLDTEKAEYTVQFNADKESIRSYFENLMEKEREAKNKEMEDINAKADKE
jgi:hypothetical protein